MSRTIYALVAVVVIFAGCFGERRGRRNPACRTNADCPTSFTCERRLCVSPSLGTKSGDDAVIVATAKAVGGPKGGIAVSVQTGQCQGARCEVSAGGDVTFTAPSVKGYRFQRWTGGGRCSGAQPVLALSKVDADVECTAQYVKRVLVSGGSGASGAELRASSSGEYAECAGASCVVDAGSKVVISAGDLSGHRFAGFDGQGCDQTEGLSVFVTAGMRDVTCMAKYLRSFEVSAQSAGTLTYVSVQSNSPYADCVGARCIVDEQDEVTISAPQILGYRFAGFGGDDACVGLESVVKVRPVTGNVNCTANYVARFSATLRANGAPGAPPLNGSSSAPFSECANGVCVVDAGSDVVFEAPAIAGYRHTGFDGEGCDEVIGPFLTLRNLRRNIQCTADYVAEFEVVGQVVDGPDERITFSAKPAQLSCMNERCVVAENSSVTLVAPRSGEAFRFVRWSGDGDCDGRKPTLELDRVKSNTTCKANYVARTSIQLDAGRGGSISVDSVPDTGECDRDSCLVDRGDTITLTANADVGFQFVEWKGCADSDLRKVRVVADKPRIDCTATFKAQRRADESRRNAGGSSRRAPLMGEVSGGNYTVGVAAWEGNLIGVASLYPTTEAVAVGRRALLDSRSGSIAKDATGLPMDARLALDVTTPTTAVDIAGMSATDNLWLANSTCSASAPWKYTPVLAFGDDRHISERALSPRTVPSSASSMMNRAAVVAEHDFVVAGYSVRDTDRARILRVTPARVYWDQEFQVPAPLPDGTCENGELSVRIIDIEATRNGFVTVSEVSFANSANEPAHLLLQIWDNADEAPALVAEQHFAVDDTSVQPMGLVATADDGWLVVGRIGELPASHQDGTWDGFWLRVDADLHPLWDGKIGTLGRSEQLSEGALTRDGESIAMVGQIWTPEPDDHTPWSLDGLVMILEASEGSIRAQWAFGQPKTADFLTDIARMPNGSFVVVGAYQEQSFYPLTIRLDHKLSIQSISDSAIIRFKPRLLRTAVGFKAVPWCGTVLDPVTYPRLESFGDRLGGDSREPLPCIAPASVIN